MRIRVEPTLCDGHALCEAIAPEVFELGDDERARVKVVEPGDDLVAAVHEAARRCPCSAIEVTVDG